MDEEQAIAILDGLFPDGVASRDAKCRESLIAAVQRLLHRVQTPTEIGMTLFWEQPMVCACVQILHDTGIWSRWSAAGRGSKSIDEICGMPSVHVDKNLLRRLLRVLSASCIITEMTLDMFEPTDYSLALGDANAYEHHLIGWSGDHVRPACTVLPRFLAKSNYQEPVDRASTSYIDAFPERLPVFERIRTNPTYQKEWDGMIAAWSKKKSPWTSFYDTRRLVDGMDHSKPLLVDVGGNVGVDLQHLLDKHPDLPPNALVLQDVPEVIARAKAHSQIHAMAHDFFTPQPVKASRAYFLRMILHDWPDSEAKQILINIRNAAEKSYSRILIADIVLPLQGATLAESVFDIQMMAMFSGCERTEASWRHLLGECGLRIFGMRKDPEGAETLLEVELV